MLVRGRHHRVSVPDDGGRVTVWCYPQGARRAFLPDEAHAGFVAPGDTSM